MKEIIVHVISVLVVEYNCWLLFAGLVCSLQTVCTNDD